MEAQDYFDLIIEMYEVPQIRTIILFYNIKTNLEVGFGSKSFTAIG